MSILFIGNFLSKSRGSLSVSETIAYNLKYTDEAKVLTASRYQNRLLRFADILISVLFKRYDVLHIDVFSGNSFLFAQIAAAIGKMRGKKIVLTLHGGALHEHYRGREQSFKKLFEGTYVQSPSTFLKSFFEKEGYEVAYCPNPLEVEKFPFKRNDVAPYSLLWVRAFTPIYNPHVPVEVLKMVLKDYPLATLTMVGPDKGLLKDTLALIERLKLTERVKVVGSVKNDELSTHYQSHAVYLNTTSYESFGVAVAEAACCGIPVVSFSVGEIPFLWKDEENILLTSPLDVERMASQVSRIFKDEALGNRLSIQARKRAEQFSWENIKPHWLKILSR